jgi:glycosyltransferase involved in cell wall biosynthesis
MIGEYSGNLEEAMRKTTFYLSEELPKHHQVLPANIKKIFFRSFWRDIKKFDPQIIHYIHGPSIKSFMIVKTIAIYCKNAKTVMSATHPTSFAFSKKIIPFVKPNLILTQSDESEKMFYDFGCKTEFLPGGVDTEKFIPVSKDTKEELREKYGIDKDKFVILHVGSIKEGRGIEIFKKIARTKDNQIVIIGNRSMGVEKHLDRSIKESGCNVLVKYFKNIEDFYALSDCYVFPTPPMNKINSIEIPLSILEAMACNLPVITTKFGALPRIFEGEDGLFFLENGEDVFTALDEIKKGIVIKTREKVLPYSWEIVVKRLADIYEKLIKS